MKRWDQARAASERRPRRLTVFAPTAGLSTIARITPEPRVPPAIDHLGRAVEAEQQRQKHLLEGAHEIAVNAARIYPGWSGPWAYSMLTHVSGACVQRRHKSNPITWNWFPVPVDRHRSFCWHPKDSIEEAMAAALGWDIALDDDGLWHCRHQTLGCKDGYFHSGGAVDAARHALQNTHG